MIRKNSLISMIAGVPIHENERVKGIFARNSISPLHYSIENVEGRLFVNLGFRENNSVVTVAGCPIDYLDMTIGSSANVEEKTKRAVG